MTNLIYELKDLDEVPLKITFNPSLQKLRLRGNLDLVDIFQKCISKSTDSNVIETSIFLLRVIVGEIKQD